MEADGERNSVTRRALVLGAAAIAICALGLTAFLTQSPLPVTDASGGGTPGKPTPTPTPTSQRPFDVAVSLVDDYPNPPVSGQEKTWVLSLALHNTPYGCEVPDWGLSVTLTGHADSSPSFDARPMACPDKQLVAITSQVTAPPGGKAGIEVYAYPIPDYNLGADNHVSASRTVCLDFDRDALCDVDDADDDNDGCADAREGGANPANGGMRDSMYFWDFFDVPTGTTLARDRAVAGGDIAAIVLRFGSTDMGAGEFDRDDDALSMPNAAVMPPGARANYHPAYDRSPAAPGADLWDAGPPDGSISGGDVAASVIQFGHNCV